MSQHGDLRDPSAEKTISIAVFHYRGQSFGDGSRWGTERYDIRDAEIVERGEEQAELGFGCWVLERPEA